MRYLHVQATPQAAEGIELWSHDFRSKRLTVESTAPHLRMQS